MAFVTAAAVPLGDTLKRLAERIDRLSLRERGLLFGGALVLIFIGWQTLLMDPLSSRAASAEQRLADAERTAEAAALAGTAADSDPAVLAATRERALRARLEELDAELADASTGYVPPERMNELLRELLQRQRGLRLVSLRNLPVVSLSRPEPPVATAGAADAARPGDPAAAESPAPGRAGPYLHPVAIVIEGDYASVVGYLRELEGLPWRLHWRQLDLHSTEHPTNRVRIEIGTVGLSRDWMSV
jgi:MSHA biogenesis protein MshJ